jgi:hypothetical protein
MQAPYLSCKALASWQISYLFLFVDYGLVDNGGVTRKRWGGGIILGMHRREEGGERTFFDFVVPGVPGWLEYKVMKRVHTD